MIKKASPMVDLRFPYVDRFNIEITGDSTLTISAGQCRDADDVFQIVSDEAINVDAAHVALNGLDTGVLENNTLYGIYVIGDLVTARPTKALISKNLNIPVMPYDYNAYRLIGYVRTDGSADFLAGKFYGNGSDRIFVYSVPVATAVTAGASTTYAKVDLTGLVPPLEGLPVLVDYDATPSAAGRILSLQSFGGDAAGHSVAIHGQVATVHVSGIAEVLASLDTGAPAIEYKWSAGGGDAVALSVSGYRYSL